MKVILGPLESEVAKVLANRRGISVAELVSNLLREEAAIEITGWRGLLPAEAKAAQAEGKPAQPAEVQREAQPV